MGQERKGIWKWENWCAVGRDEMRPDVRLQCRPSESLLNTNVLRV